MTARISALARRSRSWRHRVRARPSAWTSALGRVGFSSRATRPVAVRWIPFRPTRLAQLPLSSRWFYLRSRLLLRRRAVACSASAIIERPATALALASAGVQLHIESASIGARDAVGDELYGMLLRTESDLGGRRVRVQRAARRATLSRLERHERPDTPTVSVLLATMRPNQLTSALQQINSQRLQPIEVLVGAHGPGFDDRDLKALEHETAGPVRITQFNKSLHLGEVLEDLRRQARGVLLTKWDDDDFYGVDHLDDLVAAWQVSGADIVGKFAEFVYLAERDVTIRRTTRGFESISSDLSGGALLWSADWMDRIGGWRPLPRHVDKALIDDAWSSGGFTYRTHGYQYVLHRSADVSSHTWSAPSDHFLRSATNTWDGLALERADIDIA